MVRLFTSVDAMILDIHELQKLNDEIVNLMRDHLERDVS